MWREREVVGTGSGAVMGVIMDGLGAVTGFLWEGLSTCRLVMEWTDNTNYHISQGVARNAINMFLSLNDINCARPCAK